MPHSRETVALPPRRESISPTGSSETDEDRRWKNSLAAAIRNRAELLRRLGLDPRAPSDVAGSTADDSDFPVLVPESFLRRMRPGDPRDPLLLQVLPTAAEKEAFPGDDVDPVGDLASRIAPGLLHKYHGRALLLAHGSCAIHCRYCFRRHYPYDAEPKSLDAWTPAIEAIASDQEIHEVIFSGGDPLLLSDRRFEELLERLSAVPHLKRLRIHSRLPIVLPDRITDRWLGILSAGRLQPILVVHANHANELVDDCADALRKTVRGGIPVLNQAVLLRGINDSVEALRNLCESCVDLGVLPYYLHQLDRVQGAAHFEVSVEQGQALIESLRPWLPGYAVPRYVVEVPAAPSKVPL